MHGKYIALRKKTFAGILDIYLNHSRNVLTVVVAGGGGGRAYAIMGETSH